MFYGTLDGWFKAVDAYSGTLLWQFKTGSGIIGQPTTYRGPDGKQYVAILSGIGGWAGAIVAGGLDARDESAALGFAALEPREPEMQLLHRWLDCWRGVGDVVTGMNRQGYWLHLSNIDTSTWRATFSCQRL